MSVTFHTLITEKLGLGHALFGTPVKQKSVMLKEKIQTCADVVLF